MKDFFGGLYHYIIEILMWIPCHPLRRLACRVLMKHFGTQSSIYRKVDLRSPYRISIGNHTNINKKCLLDGRGGLTIGNNVDIAQEVNIWTEEHDYNDPLYSPLCKSVVIEDYVWIASRATILPGITIGRGAVIASGSIVTKNVSPLCIVAGVPAKVIGTRKEDALQYTFERRAWFR